MRRGIITEALGTVVIAIMVTLLLLASVHTVTEILWKQAPIQACKLSINTAAVVKAKTIGAVDVGVSCPRTILQFKDESPLAVDQRIAQEIYLCADRFGHGNLDFVTMNSIFPKDRASCFVCAVIEFKNPELITKYKKESQRLAKDLLTIKLNTPDLSAQAYFDSVNAKAKTHEQNLDYFIDPGFNPAEIHGNIILFTNIQTKSVLQSWAARIPALQSLQEQYRGAEEIYPTNHVILTDMDTALAECETLLN